MHGYGYLPIRVSGFLGEGNTVKDWDSGKLITRKVVRRKGFVLGKSSVLSVRYVAEMDNGDIRTISERRDGDIVSSHQRYGTFDSVVSGMREFERNYLTAELPEVSA